MKHDIRRMAAPPKLRRLIATAHKYYEVFKKAILPKAKYYGREFFRQKMHIPVAAFVAISIAINVVVGVTTIISKNPQAVELLSTELGQCLLTK